ncbi:MAG: hypothetical protein IH991_00275 [Planctomycetes bacterium]|nr:hypothetical protein [Planctomycetota bacterium]
MPSAGSLTRWIIELPTDEEVALEKIHERLWPLLVGRARAKLRNLPLRHVDEEDVVQSVFKDFHKALKEGRFEFENRENLLALLTTMIGRKIINHIKAELTEKRGGGKLQSGAVFEFLAEESGKQPDHEAMLADCYEHFVGSLPDHVRQFAELYLAGYTHQEISQEMQCSKRKSERKVALAKERWQQMAKRALEETVE